MLELSSVLYIFCTIYAAGLLLPFLSAERAQLTAITSVYRPLSLSLIIVHCIAAYWSDVHFILKVIASTAILLLLLSLRQELRDEREKIFGSHPLSKMLWLGLILFCMLFFGRVFFGQSHQYGFLVSGLNISVQLFLVWEIFNKLRSSKSIHLLYALIAALVAFPLLALRIFLIGIQGGYVFSLVSESDLAFLSRLVIAASFFITMNGITNFQFQKLWSTERELRIDAERQSLDNLIAISQAQDTETGNRILRKRRYVQALIDNLKPKSWFTIPDPEAHMDDLFKDSLSPRPAKSAIDGPNEASEGLGQEGSVRSDSTPQTVQVMAVADVYDVLTSERPWKRSWTHKQAIAEIAEMAGSRLDPTVVKAFLEEETTFSAIAHTWRDDP